MTEQGENIKIRLQFDKGSQTLNGCDPTAEDKDLFAVAEAISDLREHTSVKYIKITEDRLLG